MFPVVPKTEQIAGMNDHLNRWLGGGQTMVVHLYKNNFSPSQDSVLADFTEVLVGDFPGYAPIAITPSGTPFIPSFGDCEQVFTDPVFQPTADPVAPLTVFGYFVTLHPLVGADTLLYGCRLDNPPTIAFATDAVPLDPDLSQMAFTSPKSQ